MPPKKSTGNMSSEGIGQPTIWENLEAQSLLGVEGFAEASGVMSPADKNCERYPRSKDSSDESSLGNCLNGPGEVKLTRDRLIVKAVYAARLQSSGSRPSSWIALFDGEPIDERNETARIKT